MSSMLEMSIGVALISFFISFLLSYKALPFGLGCAFRKYLNIKPFNCFFCLSSWLVVVVFPLTFAFWSFSISPTFGRETKLLYLFTLPFYVFISLGIVSMLVLFVTNFFPAEQISNCGED